MPLSKERDRVRKRAERAKSRLDGQLSPPYQLDSVQPIQADSAEVYSTGIQGYDADGNPIYED